MRRILVDAARRRAREQRGRDRDRVEFDAVQPAEPRDSIDLVAPDEALTRRASEDPQAARLVELRHFGGLGWGGVWANPRKK